MNIISLDHKWLKFGWGVIQGSNAVLEASTSSVNILRLHHAQMLARKKQDSPLLRVEVMNMISSVTNGLRFSWSSRKISWSIKQRPVSSLPGRNMECYQGLNRLRVTCGDSTALGSLLDEYGRLLEPPLTLAVLQTWTCLSR